MKNYENFNLADVILKEKKVYIENNMILIVWSKFENLPILYFSIIIVLFTVLFKGNLNWELKPKCNYLYG